MSNPHLVIRVLVAAIAALIVTGSASAAARRVIFVDNRRVSGNGSYGSPFPTLAEAQQSSRMSDVLFVAETDRPYEENISLQKGQMLIGSAYGLDAVQTELNTTVDAPPRAAAQGTGPIIHGT